MTNLIYRRIFKMDGGYILRILKSESQYTLELGQTFSEPMPVHELILYKTGGPLSQLREGLKRIRHEYLCRANPQYKATYLRLAYGTTKGYCSNG